MRLSDLHDATLEHVTVDWNTGEVVLEVKTQEGSQTFKFEEIVGLELPRKHPWGPSVSINEIRDTPESCEIEMQSGDRIVIRKKLDCK